MILILLEANLCCGASSIPLKLGCFLKTMDLDSSSVLSPTEGERDN